MGINVFVQYNGEFLYDILLLTQAPIVLYGFMALLSYIITTIPFLLCTKLSSVLLCLVAPHGD